MFTGLIEAVGVVRRRTASSGGGARLAVEAPFARELEVGESVAVDGVCLTVASPPVRGTFEADLSPETLARTTLGRLVAGRRANLERALALGDRLGGHIVTGHVDFVTTIASIRPSGGFREIRFALPRPARRFVAEKGSIAISGISLTVAGVGPRDFGIAVIPKTLEKTTLPELVAGSEVNVELDLLAKYVESLLSARSAAERR